MKDRLFAVCATINAPSLLIVRMKEVRPSYKVLFKGTYAACCDFSRAYYEKHGPVKWNHNQLSLRHSRPPGSKMRPCPKPLPD